MRKADWKNKKEVEREILCGGTVAESLLRVAGGLEGDVSGRQVAFLHIRRRRIVTLDEIRTEIDAIDLDMKQLFLRRMECTKHVAETKRKTGEEVFVPAREAEIIAHRAEGLASDMYYEYVDFLRHLICISRNRQYEILTEMQEVVAEEALLAAGLSADKGHERVEISFHCDLAMTGLNLLIDMAELNQINILEMRMNTSRGRQEISMVLEGNVNDASIKKLLCQIGKETKEFKILGLY